jgi:hypothetical protein
MLVVHQWVEVPNEQPQQPRIFTGDCHCSGEGVALLTIILLDVTEQRRLALQRCECSSQFSEQQVDKLR